MTQRLEEKAIIQDSLQFAVKIGRVLSVALDKVTPSLALILAYSSCQVQNRDTFYEQAREAIQRRMHIIQGMLGLGGLPLVDWLMRKTGRWFSRVWHPPV
jgi:hypothetical protein